jgi:hypothetical protein
VETLYEQVKCHLYETVQVCVISINYIVYGQVLATRRGARRLRHDAGEEGSRKAGERGCARGKEVLQEQQTLQEDRDALGDVFSGEDIFMPRLPAAMCVAFP